MILSEISNLLNYFQSETGADEVSFRILVENQIQLFFIWYGDGPIQDMYCTIILEEGSDADEQYEANYIQYLAEKANFQHYNLLKKEQENVIRQRKERIGRC